MLVQHILPDLGSPPLSLQAQFNDLPTLADQVVVGTAVGEQIALLTHTPFTRNTHERYA